MKVLIVSDTHRKHKNLEIALERQQPIDLLIHLGDAEGCEDYIAELAGCPLEIVAGNSDFFSLYKARPRNAPIRNQPKSGKNGQQSPPKKCE